MSAVAPLSSEEMGAPTRVRRAHAAPAQRREMVKTTAGHALTSPSAAGSLRPQLHVVPRRRRRAVGAMVLMCAVLFSLLLGATAFQTQIARNQLDLDRADRGVQVARERYENLRRARAELRSPIRLATLAAELGMVPAENGAFMSIDGSVSARVVAVAGDLPKAVSDVATDPFDQFAQIKAASGEAP